MEIVLNTLNAQQHVCNRIPPTVVMPDASKTKGLLFKLNEIYFINIQYNIFNKY